MNAINYQVGADDSLAPWNEESLPPVEVEVFVTITLSKTIKIKTDRYTRIDYGKDEDGCPEFGYEFEDLEGDVRESVTFPQDLAEVLEDAGEISSGKCSKAISECKGWDLEEIYVDET